MLRDKRDEKRLPIQIAALQLQRQNVVYISRNCRPPAENVEKDLDAP